MILIKNSQDHFRIGIVMKFTANRSSTFSRKISILFTMNVRALDSILASTLAAGLPKNDGQVFWLTDLNNRILTFKVLYK